MVARQSKRRSIITCPQCGHLEVRARTCDIEMQCRRCHYRFEAVIGPYAETDGDPREASDGKSDAPNPNQARPSKSNQPQP